MNRLDPILRRATAYARRSPWWALAVMLGTLAFAMAGVTAPLVSGAAADGAFTTEASEAASSSRLGQGLDARAYTLGLTDGAPLAAVTARLDEMPVYGPAAIAVSPLAPYTDADEPVAFVRAPSGREATALVLGIDDPDTALGTAPGGEAPTDGVRIPDSLAAQLGIEAGDEVTVGLRYPNADEASVLTATTTVTAVYATSDGLPAAEDTEWGGPRGVALRDPRHVTQPVAMLVTDPSTAVSLISTVGDTAFVTWDVRWEGPVTLQSGRKADDAVTRARSDLLDDSSYVKAMAAVHGRSAVLSSGVGGFVDRADAAVEQLEPLVSSIALTARVVSGLIVVVAIALLTRSREREHRLTLSMGVHPVRIALVTVLEFLAPLVAAGACAYAVVRWQPRLVAGDGTINTSTVESALSAVRIQPVYVAGLIAVTALAVVAPMQPRRSGAASRVVGPFQGTIIATVAAAVTGAQLLTTKGKALDSGTSLLFPLFTLLAGSSIVVRVLAAATGRLTRTGLRSRRPTRRPRSLTVWMTVRRLASALSRQSAVAVMVSVGVGMFVYCGTIARDGQRGLADKAAALGGAEATLELRSTEGVTLGADGLPSEVPSGQSIVWTTTNLPLGIDLPSDLLVVDPRTFAAAVTWGTTFSGRSLPEVLDELADNPPGAVNLVLAGNYTADFPENGRIDLDGGRGSIQYRVVDRIAAAPWQRERATMAIALAPAVGEQLVELEAREAAIAAATSDAPPAAAEEEPRPAAAALDRVFGTFVWSSGPQADLDATWSERSLDTIEPNVPIARRQPEFVAYRLFLPYLRLVGSAMLVTATVALMVLGARRRSDLAVEAAMLRRMGMPARVTVVSVVAGALSTVLVGAGTGVLLARFLAGFMTSRLDPGPSFAPRLVTRSAGIPIVVGVSVVLVAALVGTSAELIAARRARVSEVLRGAE